MSCHYPDCVTKTDGHRYCRYHNAWIRQNGLCFQCLQRKENPQNKHCSICHHNEQKCHYPNCQAATDSMHPYCPAHATWIRQDGLCYKCLIRKEDPQFKFCAACHREELWASSQVNRQLAIKQGLCTNYWRCHAPAVRAGSLCASCYQEYLLKRPAPVLDRSPLNIKRPDPPTVPAEPSPIPAEP